MRVVRDRGLFDYKTSYIQTAEQLSCICLIEHAGPGEAGETLRAVRQLRSLVERLQALKDMHQQEMNRMEAATASGDELAIGLIREHVSYLESAIKRLQEGIDEHMTGQPELHGDAQLLTSIAGIGTVTVAKVLAYAGDLKRFG